MNNHSQNLNKVKTTSQNSTQFRLLSEMNLDVELDPKEAEKSLQEFREFNKEFVEYLRKTYVPKTSKTQK